MADAIRVGQFTPLFMALGFAITGAVGFLGVIDMTSLTWPVIVLFIGGIVLTLFAKAIRPSSVAFHPANPGVLIVSVMVSLALMGFSTALLYQLGLGMAMIEGGLLVVILFAIYEETFMLGMNAVLKAAGLPDLYCLVVSTMVFVPMHALVYSLVLSTVLFLVISRVILTAGLFITDNSDEPFATHILWNVLVVGI